MVKLASCLYDSFLKQWQLWQQQYSPAHINHICVNIYLKHISQCICLMTCFTCVKKASQNAPKVTSFCVKSYCVVGSLTVANCKGINLNFSCEIFSVKKYIFERNSISTLSQMKKSYFKYYQSVGSWKQTILCCH